MSIDGRPNLAADGQRIAAVIRRLSKFADYR
jgi:hypothetical protein